MSSLASRLRVTRAVGNQAPRWPYRINRASPLVPGEPVFLGLTPGLRAPLDISIPRHAIATQVAPARAILDGGHAFDFNGSSQYIDYADEEDFDFATGDKMTVAFTVVPRGMGGGLEHILGKWGQSSNADGWAVFGNTVSGAISLVWDNGNESDDYVSTTSLTNGAAYRVVFVRDGTTEQRAYVNGKRVETKTSSTTVSNSAAAFAVGHQASISGRHFDGILGNVLILKGVAWTDAQARHDYDPQTRWGLYDELGLRTFVLPAPTGAAVTTLDLSLEAAVRRQFALTMDLDAAVQAVRSAQTDLHAAVQREAQADADLNAALQAAQTLSSALSAAVSRVLTVSASLDASLTGDGISFVLASLEAAVRRLVTTSSGLDAAVETAVTTLADLDAVVALAGEAAAALDAVVERVAVLLGAGLDAAVLGTPSLTARLDAAVGTVILPAKSRTGTHPGRGATYVIPPGDRRH